MIFHTSCDYVYYNKFFSTYKKSIEKNFQNPKFSLNYVGKEKIHTDLYNLSYEKVELKDIEKKYDVQGRDALGYYAISRFLSIPVLNDHVVVSDVDIAAINPIDENLILDLLQKYKVINVTRKKPNGSEGGMAIMILHKDICAETSKKSKEIISSVNLKWNTDVQVKKYLLNTYSHTSLLQMHDISKNSDVSGINSWFVFSKIGKLKEAKLKSVL